MLLALVAITAIVCRHKIANQIARAGGRRAIANHTAAPIDLTGNYIELAANFNRNGFWKCVPTGFQVFNHVPLQIDGTMCLWGDGNAKMGDDYPEQVLGIAVNQKFETLYVYHCTFFGSPNNTPVYNLVFRYEDDYSVTNTIRYGIDTIDFNTPGGKKMLPPEPIPGRPGWAGLSRRTESGRCSSA